MFLYFENTKRLYPKLWCVYLLAFPIFYIMNTYAFSFLLSFFLAFGIECCLWIIILSRTQKKANQQMSEICIILSNQLNIVSYFQAINQLKSSQVKNLNQRILLAYYEAIGVAIQGNYYQALSDLEKLPLDVVIKQYAWPIHLFMARLAMVLKDNHKAERYYQESVRLKGNTPLQNVQMCLSLKEVEMTLNYVKGNVDDVLYEDFLTSFLETNKLSLLYQVILQSSLFQLYQKTGQVEKAIVAATFLFEHGGSLQLVQGAKLFLGKEATL